MFVLFAANLFSGCATKEEWNRFWDSMEKNKGHQPEAAPRQKSSSKALQGAISFADLRASLGHCTTQGSLFVPPPHPALTVLP